MDSSHDKVIQSLLCCGWSSGADGSLSAPAFRRTRATGRIARAIVTDPTIIVADEPTGDLDAKSAEEIRFISESFPNPEWVRIPSGWQEHT